MNCLELSIPPLPQFVTGNFAAWSAGQKHVERRIDVYDVLFVISGKMYMTEAGIPYEIQAGELLVLTPDSLHFGHQECEEATEIYWFHFVHPHPVRMLPRDEIPWLNMLPRGISKDTLPPEHVMYLPKHARIDMSLFIPLLERLVGLQSYIRVENALELHQLLIEILSRLQQMVCHQFALPSQRVSSMVMEYMRNQLAEPFKAEQMEEELHYSYDYISRCFKRHTGMTPVEYLHYVRMEEARRLLVGSNLSVREIGEAVGLPDCNYFIKLFRKMIGLTPGKYRDHRKGLV